MKRKISLLLAAVTLSSVALTGCLDGKIGSKNSAKAPDQITVLAQTCMNEEEGLQQVCDEYQRKTGTKLVVERPGSDVSYYDVVAQKIAASTPPDVIEMGGFRYASYASSGELWDMTADWEGSEANAKKTIGDNIKYVDALRVGTDNKLYGFPVAKGNGTITYVRGDWMDELGIKEPTNYNEFLDMLRKFKAKCNTPYTAAGLINSESPYDMYLREFYQNANPDFYIKDGKFVDGMLQPEMRDALKRIADAYREGLIDSGISTKSTSEAKEALETGNAAVFNYWAGADNDKMQEKIKKSYRDAYKAIDVDLHPDQKAEYDRLKALSERKDLIKPLAPIAETKYIERPPVAYTIPKGVKNPKGVYKNFIEYMHDGAEGQLLFTRGVEGIHWQKKEDGTLEAIPYNPEKNKTKTLAKAFYSPELALTPIEMDNIGWSDVTKNSLSKFEGSNSNLVALPIASDVIMAERANIEQMRKDIITDVVLGNCTVEEGIAKYKSELGDESQKIVDELNSKLQG